MEARKAMAKVTPGLEEQFVTGRLYGKLNLHGQKKSLKNWNNMYMLFSCSLYLITPWTKWKMWWLHFRRKGAWVLWKKNKGQKEQIIMKNKCRNKTSVAIFVFHCIWLCRIQLKLIIENSFHKVAIYKIITCFKTKRAMMKLIVTPKLNTKIRVGCGTAFANTIVWIIRAAVNPPNSNWAEISEGLVNV